MPLALAVALGGSAGALARYGLDRVLERHLLALFPWSTFAINVSGCFTAGLVVASVVDRHELPDWVRVGLVIGFLGAYTTFSTFAQETRDLLVEGHNVLAFTNVALSTTAGVLAVVGGTVLGRTL